MRNGFSRELASLLVDDLRRAPARLERHASTVPAVDRRAGFHH